MLSGVPPGKPGDQISSYGGSCIAFVVKGSRYGSILATARTYVGHDIDAAAM